MKTPSLAQLRRSLQFKIGICDQAKRGPRRKPILHIIKTMLQDKDVCVRRLREGYGFFKSMPQRRSDLEAAKAAAA